jgi:hypothetical protein
MKEWHRTVALVILLAFALGFIIWLNTGLEQAALNTLQ